MSDLAQLADWDAGACIRFVLLVLACIGIVVGLMFVPCGLSVEAATEGEGR